MLIVTSSLQLFSKVCLDPLGRKVNTLEPLDMHHYATSFGGFNFAPPHFHSKSKRSE